MGAKLGGENWKWALHSQRELPTMYYVHVFAAVLEARGGDDTIQLRTHVSAAVCGWAAE